MSGVSELLKSARLERGFSQRKLAEALTEASGRDTLTRSEVSRWESGRRIPRDYWQDWLSQVLGIPLDDLRREAYIALMGNSTNNPPVGNKMVTNGVLRE